MRQGSKCIYFSCFLLMTCFLASCSIEDKSFFSSAQGPVQGEYIYRKQDEFFFQVEAPALVERKAYPWEEKIYGNYSKITKDFFRCKGSSLNPVRFVQVNGAMQRFYDCGGPQKHSLPLRDQKEFIFPVLIDLLNYIQMKTGKRVVITCGHCCPDHQAYLDPSSASQCSKHLLGAEVDFYVQEMEEQPEKVIDLILAYYRETPKYQGLKEFEEFKRYKSEEGGLSTTPWYNKELFIKVLSRHEGRDFDNRHPYPYMSIQVRYDWDLQEKVIYSWEKANRNFLRW